MGIIVDLMPSVYSGKALGELIASESVEWGNKIGREPQILIPRARIGTDEVISPLEQAAIKFTDIAVYDTLEAEYAAKDEEELSHYRLIDFASEDVDYVAFTSASTVRGFTALSGLSDFTGIKAVCIGEKTAEEAQKHGMQCFIAKEATIDSVIECFLEL